MNLLQKFDIPEYEIIENYNQTKDSKEEKSDKQFLYQFHCNILKDLKSKRMHDKRELGR